MQFVQCLWLEVFVELRCLSHLKTHLNGCHGNQSVSCDQALDKLSEKSYSRLLVQEEHGCQKGGTMSPPLAAGAQKKPGLDRDGAPKNKSSTITTVTASTTQATTRKTSELS